MAQNLTIFLNLLSLYIFILSYTPQISNGFTLTLTHRDFPQSPLYTPNLSDFQRFVKNAEISKTRASHFRKRSQTNLNTTKKLLENKSFHLPLTYRETIFTVELALGTPLTTRTLIFDTGSGLTWTQCKPCIRCFKQKEPLFDTKSSKSYKMLTKNDEKPGNIFSCTNQGCVYYVKYYSGQMSTGIASSENFYFGGNITTRLVFGCGIINKGPFGKTKTITGIFGLDRQPVSFARQLSSQIKDRFSYCLQSKNNHQSRLKFGDEANVREPNIQSTPFLKISTDERHYRLKLSDISINEQKLGLGESTFPEGCVVDSGSSVSLLPTKAHSAVRKAIDGHFSKIKNVRKVLGKRALPGGGFVCYAHGKSFDKRLLPNMSLHFEGADYRVNGRNLFVFFRRFFCMAVIKSADVTILGAYQQQDVRVLYDLKADRLSFAPEDCSKDSGKM